ncbi:MAG: hypothetical protein AABX96_04985 [Nanoarchaeota archaeon]
MISNASPLIYLSKLNKLDLLINLFNRIEITQSVYDEIIYREDNYKPEVEIIKDFIDKELIVIEKLDEKMNEQSNFIKKSFKLHTGESDTIALALQKRKKEVIIDEKYARKAAELYGLFPIGTFGAILLAYKRNIISEQDVKNIVGGLISGNFRIGADVLNEFWKLFDLVKLEKIASKSKLTVKDAEDIGDKIKKRIAERHGL